jgi:ABC-type transport system substrate-binding protein
MLVMRLKQLLLIAPLTFAVLLLQSYFWVPTYEVHANANPSRNAKYIEASIGDAKLLNPAVNSDTASSRITDLVFDGLLEIGPDLSLAGKLATDWNISEQAYLIVDTASRFPDGLAVTPESLLTRIRAAAAQGKLPLLSDVQLAPSHNITTVLTRTDAKDESVEVKIRVEVPPRILFYLSKVDQDLRANLTPIIGETYALGFDRQARVTAENSADALGEDEINTFLPVVEHNPVILFTLRQGVRFHDGHLFDAGDVKFTYEAIMNPRNLSPRTSNFEPIKSLEIVGDNSIRVIYKRLFSPAIDAWTMGILPEHLLNDHRLALEADEQRLSEAAKATFGIRDSSFNRNPIGTGPYKFVEWQGDEFIHLRRDEEYWAGAPGFRDFYYRVIPDPLTQELEFRAGAIDRYSPQPHQAVRFRELPEFQAYSSPGYSFAYIGYNNRQPPFDDARVRRALGMALNVDELIEFVLHGEGERTSGPYPANTQWYDPSVESLAYDPLAAVELLAEAGWLPNADGWLEKEGTLFEFTLVTNNGNLVRKAIMTIAQDNWRKIGIKCDTQLFEWAVFLEDFINPANFDAVVLGWSMSIGPDLYQIWHSSETGFGQFNFVGFNNEVADDLILRIRKEYDPQVQRTLAHQLHQVIADEQPYTFLYAPLITQIYDKKIRARNPDGDLGPLQVPASGDPFDYFSRWEKAALTPNF